jgi:hypothetical protein
MANQLPSALKKGSDAMCVRKKNIRRIVLIIMMSCVSNCIT